MHYSIKEHEEVNLLIQFYTWIDERSKKGAYKDYICSHL